ncbi:hypothetical protein MLD38_029083 [Melastoma candidum]|uniref:Uncharacterized protein n=1 Tax=Melastoma candidum TaxID=119954 RepID=A0ACB9N2M3_9MYRT|nr:hypothetical protein MLD38_029083 [Melastoma candidum]
MKGERDVPRAAVIKSLASLIRKPGFPVVPQVCIRAGSALLDIVQASPSRFPLSSQELFGILDDASENTFLSGPTLMMQKNIFDKDAGKIGLETKNLVAFTSFLLEQKLLFYLVNAWMADKDAEALRCQKLLVEEEEAAQRRQAELLEKKRLRRLRQKEQKAKGNKSGEILDVNDILPELENGYTNSGSFKNARLLRPPGDSHQHTHAASWTVQRRFRGLPGVLNEVYRNSSSKPEFKHRHGNQDSKNSNINSKKVWSRKSKPDKESEDLNSRVHEAFPEADQGKKREVLIGSIAVALGGCASRPSTAQSNRSRGKLWRPVSRNGVKDTDPDPASDSVSHVASPSENVPPGSPGTDRSANEGRSDTCESNAPRNLNVNASDLIKVDKTKPDKSLKKKYIPKQR